MSTPLQLWRDALDDLGVIGLVPPEGVEAGPIPKPEARAYAVQSPAGQAGKVSDRGLARRKSTGELLVAASVQRSAVPVQAPVFQAPEDPIGNPPPDVFSKAETLPLLEKSIGGCLACPLGKGRIRFVFGEGDSNASLMFIGEGPGRDEDMQGRPFVGKAGELLEKMIEAIGLKREQVYIANVVKCRPPDNRTPLPQESQRCLPYLKRQIELIQPKVIVTLGATPLRELLNVKAGITQIRGQWQRLDMNGGIPVMPTFHPAYVLRQYTQDVRRAVWNDLLAAKTWLDKPVQGGPPGRAG